MDKENTFKKTSKIIKALIYIVLFGVLIVFILSIFGYPK